MLVYISTQEKMLDYLPTVHTINVMYTVDLHRHIGSVGQMISWGTLCVTSEIIGILSLG